MTKARDLANASTALSAEYAQHLIDVAAWEAEQAEKALENASE
jgi:hypothetical protein